MSFDEYFGVLYRYGTGWLGWSHEQTMATPMPLILEAQAGRIEMITMLLKAVFPTKESGRSKPEPMTAEKRRHVAQRLLGLASSHSRRN